MENKPIKTRNKTGCPVRPLFSRKFSLLMDVCLKPRWTMETLDRMDELLEDKFPYFSLIFSIDRWEAKIFL